MYSGDNTKSYRPLLLGVALALISVLGAALWWFSFTQDDAFITFRYAANFADGHGLVWNVGERIEGYTNFLWLMFLIFFKNLGLDYLLTVRLLGFLSSALTILLTVFLAFELSKTKRILVALSAGILLTLNYSFIYWTAAGLETALFTALTLSAFVLYRRRSWAIVPVLAVAMLTRPEGVLLAGFFPLFAWWESRRAPSAELKALALALLLVGPFLVFKLYYYGDLAPNPFYAKTDWTMGQLSSGLKYLGEFVSAYTLFGVVYAIPLLRYRRLPESARALFLFAALYTVYIVLVGGDVLKVGRFFLPILAPLYIAFVVSLATFTNHHWLRWLNLLAPALTLVLALVLPWGSFQAYLTQERNLYEKTDDLMNLLLASDSGSFSVATPTIGLTGYRLLGHDVYDMVGLTDTVVSRHPETVAGLTTSWLEPKYSAARTITLAPDYIVFSTGLKPSSPGERALFLYPSFLSGYHPIGWFQSGQSQAVYRRSSAVLDPPVRSIDIRFAQEYTAGVQAWSDNQFDSALAHFQRAEMAGPQPPYGLLYYFRAKCQVGKGNHESASRLFDRSLELDSNLYVSHLEQWSVFRRIPQMSQQAAEHRSHIQRLTPWLIPLLDSLERSR